MQCGYQRDPQVHLQHRCFRDMGLWRLLGGQVDTRFVGRHVARNEHCHQGALTYSGGGSNVGSVLAGYYVLVQCDNMAVVHIIVANYNKDTTVMHLLRGLHFCLGIL